MTELSQAAKLLNKEISGFNSDMVATWIRLRNGYPLREGQEVNATVAAYVIKGWTDEAYYRHYITSIVASSDKMMEIMETATKNTGLLSILWLYLTNFSHEYDNIMMADMTELLTTALDWIEKFYDIDADVFR